MKCKIGIISSKETQDVPRKEKTAFACWKRRERREQDLAKERVFLWHGCTGKGIHGLMQVCRTTTNQETGPEFSSE